MRNSIIRLYVILEDILPTQHLSQLLFHPNHLHSTSGLQIPIRSIGAAACACVHHGHSNSSLWRRVLGRFPPDKYFLLRRSRRSPLRRSQGPELEKVSGRGEKAARGGPERCFLQFRWATVIYSVVCRGGDGQDRASVALDPEVLSVDGPG